MKVRIEIDTSTFVRFWLVVIGFAFAIYLLYLSRAALVIIAAAAFLAIALSGPVNNLCRYIPGRSRVGATALAFVIVVATLAVFVSVVVPPIVQQTLKFANNAPQLVETASRQWSSVGNLVEKYQLQPQLDTALENIRSQSTSWLNRFSSGLLSGVSSAFSMIGATMISLVLAFLMLVEGPGWLKKVWNLYDDNEKMQRHRSLVSKMHRVIAGYVNGQFLVAGIGSLATGFVVICTVYSTTTRQCNIHKRFDTIGK